MAQARECARDPLCLGRPGFQGSSRHSARGDWRRLNTIPLRPTFFVNSGHGIHCYWLLKEEEDASPGNGQRRIEEVLQLICNYIGGDPQAAETARLLRLPGSHNTRNAGESLLVTLEDVNLSRRYDLSEL